MRKILNLLFALSFFCSLCSCNRTTHTEAFYYPIVESEGEAIVDIPGAKIINHEHGSKYGSAWYDRNLFVEADPSGVIEYYDNELERLGWKFSSSNNNYSFLSEKIYCKGSLQTDVALFRNGSGSDGTKFIIYVNWSGVTERDCKSHNG